MKTKLLYITLAFVSHFFDGAAQVKFEKCFDRYGITNTGRAITNTSDGGYAAIATSEGCNANGCYSNSLILKIDISGNLQWAVDHGYADGLAINRTHDDGFVIAGQALDTALFDNFYVARLDKTGNMIWDNYIDIGTNEALYSVIQARNFDFVITGYTNNNLYLARLDTNGALRWSKNVSSGGFKMYTGNSVIESKDGGLVVAGAFYNPDTSKHTIAPTPVSGLYIIKFDANGNKLWDKEIEGSLNGSSPFGLSSVIEVHDDNYVIAGSSIDSTGKYQLMVLKFSTSGVNLWKRTLEFSGGNAPLGLEERITVTETNDYKLLIAGSFSFNSGSSAASQIIKLNSNGTYNNALQSSGKGGLQTVGGAVKATDGGLVILGSTAFNPADSTSIHLIKFDNTQTGCLTNYSTCIVDSSIVCKNGNGLVTNLTTPPIHFGGYPVAHNFTQTNLCTTTGINNFDNNTTESFRFYPNPSSVGSTITFELSEYTTNNLLSIYDIKGQEVYSEFLQNEKTTITTDLPSGMYFVSVISENKIFSAKLIIE